MFWKHANDRNYTNGCKAAGGPALAVPLALCVAVAGHPALLIPGLLICKIKGLE